MTLNIQFKGFVLTEIEDTEKDYSVFQGTFSEDATESRTDVTLVLGSGARVSFESTREPYGSPRGVIGLTQYMRDILVLVHHNQAEETTLAELIQTIQDSLYYTCDLVIRNNDSEAHATLHRNPISQGYGIDFREDSEDLEDLYSLDSIEAFLQANKELLEDEDLTPRTHK